MANTEAIRFSCASVHSEPEGRNTLVVEIGQPNIDELLADIRQDDLTAYVARELQPEDVFSESELEKWAEANGYVKGGENE